MMTNLIRIKSNEYQVPFVRFRETDYRHDRRSTVTIVTELEYAAVVALFTDPGEWSAVRHYEPFTDAEGNTVQEADIVTDCTGYDVLCSIRDNRDGLLEVVMGKITDSEALAELREVLEG